MKAVGATSGMMGGAGEMGVWILLWIFLGMAVAVTGGFVAARVLGTRHEPDRPQARAPESPAMQEAKDALRLRYAHGEISREEYLQGKVELEG